MADNPRIEELRQRLAKEPGSRLFAQLAEELRKDGDFEESIQVCRDGLVRHPAYPSARMTLGRALMDTGDTTGARGEFEKVLKAAPDNILASRYLGECLETLGDVPGAIARFKTTLALVPGDKTVLGHLQALEARSRAPIAAPAEEPVEESSAVAGPEPPPIPLVAVEESFELEAPSAPPPPPQPKVMAAAAAPPPIPLVEIEESFELEAQHVPVAAPAILERAATEDLPPIPIVAAEESFELEAPSAIPSPPPGVKAVLRDELNATIPPPKPAPRPETAPVEEASFDFDLPPEAVRVEAPTVLREAPIAPEPARAPVPPRAPEPLRAAEPRIASAPVVAPEPPVAEDLRAPEEAPLSSATLGELYFNQGFTDKAIEVYRSLVAKEPTNERARARLGELESLLPPLPKLEDVDPRSARRALLERTIASLEKLMVSLKRA